MHMSPTILLKGINDLGFWALVEEKEYFIPFSDYPGFLPVGL